jgi:hypothetical protein
MYYTVYESRDETFPPEAKGTRRQLQNLAQRALPARPHAEQGCADKKPQSGEDLLAESHGFCF